MTDAELALVAGVVMTEITRLPEKEAGDLRAAWTAVRGAARARRPSSREMPAVGHFARARAELAAIDPAEEIPTTRQKILPDE